VSGGRQRGGMVKRLAGGIDSECGSAYGIDKLPGDRQRFAVAFYANESARKTIYSVNS
jgi:hypothetical protein